MSNDEHVLWRIGDAECVMISCCAGAELRIRRGDDDVVRELYPTKSDLYERARELHREWTRTAGDGPHA
jgi:hypothetical protein